MTKYNLIAAVPDGQEGVSLEEGKPSRKKHYLSGRKGNDL